MIVRAFAVTVCFARLLSGSSACRSGGCCDEVCGTYCDDTTTATRMTRARRGRGCSASHTGPNRSRNRDTPSPPTIGAEPPSCTATTCGKITRSSSRRRSCAVPQARAREPPVNDTKRYLAIDRRRRLRQQGTCEAASRPLSPTVLATPARGRLPAGLGARKSPARARRCGRSQCGCSQTAAPHHRRPARGAYSARARVAFCFSSTALLLAVHTRPLGSRSRRGRSRCARVMARRPCKVVGGAHCVLYHIPRYRRPAKAGDAFTPWGTRARRPGRWGIPRPAPTCPPHAPPVLTVMGPLTVI